MWYFIVIGILVIGISLIILGNIDWDYEKHKFMWKHDSVFRITGWSIFIPTIITFVIMTSCVVDAHMNLPAKLEEKQETYAALTYKMESTTCRDEFGFLSKEVIDEVQEWNTDVRYYKAAQKDPWVGIWVPDIYDNLETIEYESYVKE